MRIMQDELQLATIPDEMSKSVTRAVKPSQTMTKEEADLLVMKGVDPLSPVHDRSLNISEVEESVKKFYPDAA